MISQDSIIITSQILISPNQYLRSLYMWNIIILRNLFISKRNLICAANVPSNDDVKFDLAFVKSNNCKLCKRDISLASYRICMSSSTHI